MEFNEQWIPIIHESIQWVKDKMKPTKTDLKLKISDLEEQVKMLSYGNQVLTKNIGDILSIVLSKLEMEEKYIINADTIVQIKDNGGQIQMININEENVIKEKKSIGSIFDDIDTEIMQCRLTRPSERE